MMNTSITYASTILPVIGLLVLVVNIITQVLKQVTWDKLPTSLLALVISMALTLVAGAAYCEIKAIPITWYMIAGAVVLGFAVAYAAMFGYDKLVEIISKYKETVSK